LRIDENKILSGYAYILLEDYLISAVLVMGRHPRLVALALATAWLLSIPMSAVSRQLTETFRTGLCQNMSGSTYQDYVKYNPGKRYECLK
jgi:hypothetical protein